jgi:hypothetical protein
LSKLPNTGAFNDNVSSDMLETEEKGLHPILYRMEVLTPLSSCGWVVLWESTPGLVSSGVDLRLGGGLPSNLEIGVVINFNLKIGI